MLIFFPLSLSAGHFLPMLEDTLLKALWSWLPGPAVPPVVGQLEPYGTGCAQQRAALASLHSVPLQSLLPTPWHTHTNVSTYLMITCSLVQDRNKNISLCGGEFHTYIHSTILLELPCYLTFFFQHVKQKYINL